MSTRHITDEMLQRVMESDPELSAALDAVYAEVGDTMIEAAEDYHNRHMTQSMNVLTVCSAADARRLVKPLRGKILNRSVVEVGGGVGCLALELAKYSPEVISIESDPAWSWVFCNPPWSNIPPFIELARFAELAVLLVPARTNCKWFHRALSLGARPEYWQGKLNFSGKWNSPIDCLLLIWDSGDKKEAERG